MEHAPGPEHCHMPGHGLVSGPEPTLDPLLIPKYVTELPIPPVFAPRVVRDRHHETTVHKYKVTVSEFMQQVLPAPFGQTRVWGYGGRVRGADECDGDVRSYPGPTFEAVRGTPVEVTWINELRDPHFLPVDPTLHWANPNGLPMHPPMPWPPFPPGFAQAQCPVPIVTHLHGAEVRSDSDGHPDAWFTYNDMTGPAFRENVSRYPNSQLPTTLWYHDHALGITRLNVLAGLAGFYILRARDDEVEALLPHGRYEIPLVIQDRSFNEDGSLFFPSVGVNPMVHPYWVPEFNGNAITVNGRTWPNLNVKRRQYRFRILNGSNARFYNLNLSGIMPFTQIGSEGGYLPSPVVLDEILSAPAERADVLVDFSNLPVGTTVIMRNTARAPFPTGDPPDLDTVGQIMQFTVVAGRRVEPIPLPPTLARIPELVPNAPARTLTLNEVMGLGGPLEVLLNGQHWRSVISEMPRVGSTEDWEIVNLTADTHPIHLHLVQFQLASRQAFDAARYASDWTLLNGEPPLMDPTIALGIGPYVTLPPEPPADNETGWKDTVRANPEQVTRIRVRYAPQDADLSEAVPGINLYPFDPTYGPGYVWHCHILDHEDNEMMRPYRVIK